MREPDFRSQRSVVVPLIIANVVVFAVQLLVEQFSKFPLNHYFALSLPMLQKGWIWQLFTFQFMHSGPMHIAGNLFAIWMFGRAVEEIYGRAGFLKLYLASGVLGGLVQMLGAYLWEARFGGAVVGASAGGAGLIAAFATLYPNRMLAFILIPVEFRARTLIIGLAIIGVVGCVLGKDNIAHAAHLGGMLGGILYVRLNVNGLGFNWRPMRQRERKRELVKAAMVRETERARARTSTRVEPDPLNDEEFISKEVDPILEKISAHGIHSLTERERKILEAARAKMTRR